MEKDDISTQLKQFEAAKEHNDSLHSAISQLFDTVLAEHDYTHLDDAADILDDADLVLTGEICRTVACLKTYYSEIRFRKNRLFMDDVCSYKELNEKYIRTELLLRRVELYPDDIFSEETYEYICRNSISPSAVICISDSDKYEDKRSIVFNVWAAIKSRIDTATRLEWLTVIGMTYPDDNIFLETASLYLDYGQYNNALSALAKINNPSIDVISLKAELEALING